MKKVTLLLASTVVLSGCIQSDDLLPERTRKAQQELRREPLMQLSCRRLQQNYIAQDVPLAILAGAAGHMAQNRGDLKVVMQRKGCRVPA